MLKSTAIAVFAAATLGLVAAGTASAAPINVPAIADAKPANELVQVGFKKRGLGIRIHIGGGYRHGYRRRYHRVHTYSGGSCRGLYWRWQETGSHYWRKRYKRCIGVW